MSSATSSRLRVLFVDDETAIREVMKNELPRMGHDVTLCENGQAALKALEQQTFDAAIVDLKMPGLSGWDVIDHIKKVSPETEVVISTGHGDMEAAIQAVRRGLRLFTQALLGFVPESQRFSNESATSAPSRTRQSRWNHGSKPSKVRPT